MTKEFELEQKKVREWIESVMTHKKALAEADSEELGLELCGEKKAVFIYEGIEKIAFYLGLTLTYNPNWDSEGKKGYISTEYKKTEIYELWHK